MFAPRPPENLLLDQRDLFGPERHHFRVHLDQFPGRHPEYRKHSKPANPLESRVHSDSRVCGARGFFTAVLGTGYLRVPGPAPSLGTGRKDVATVRTVRFTGGKSSFSQWERLFAPLNFCTVSGQSIPVVNKGHH